VTSSGLGKIHVAATSPQYSAAFDGLSKRQRQILELLVQARSNKEIARTLQLAEGTVKIHIAALFGKLGVKRRSAAAVMGAQLLTPMLKPNEMSPPATAPVLSSARVTFSGTARPFSFPRWPVSPHFRSRTTRGRSFN
jgi:DNA-binding CsgD family transcriptional regulator